MRKKTENILKFHKTSDHKPKNADRFRIENTPQDAANPVPFIIGNFPESMRKKNETKPVPFIITWIKLNSYS